MATPTPLPASFVAGNVLQAAQLNNLRGAFRILQVINDDHSTSVSNSTTTYAATGLTATITPSSTSSKILIFASINGCEKSNGNAGNGLNLRLMRGTTNISQFATILGWTNTTNFAMTSGSVCFLDSPATTSATTYSVDFANNVAAASVTVQANGVMSTLTLLEVSA